MSDNVCFFSCEVSKDGSVDYQIKSEPFEAVVEWTWLGDFSESPKVIYMA